jgi:hypothetical protein
MAETDGCLYFFLYPAGHLSLTAVNFLVTFSLVQVIFDLDPTVTLSAAALSAAEVKRSTIGIFIARAV